MQGTITGDDTLVVDALKTDYLMSSHGLNNHLSELLKVKNDRRLAFDMSKVSRVPSVLLASLITASLAQAPERIILKNCSKSFRQTLVCVELYDLFDYED